MEIDDRTKPVKEHTLLSLPPSTTVRLKNGTYWTLTDKVSHGLVLAVEWPSGRLDGLRSDDKAVVVDATLVLENDKQPDLPIPFRSRSNYDFKPALAFDVPPAVLDDAISYAENEEG